MVTETIADGVREHLYAQPGKNVFAVLDGGSATGLLPAIDRHQPPTVCLSRAGPPDDAAEIAPHLVQLERGNPFVNWVIEEGWGNHWGVFAITDADLPAMRRHFRMFLTIKDSGGESQYFRFYDPRVLRVYLPTCGAIETRSTFGPIAAYLMEASSADTLLRFWREPNAPRKEVIKLT